MTQSTLYLVQASYHHTPRIIEELAKLFHKDDQIVLWVTQLLNFR